MEVKPILARASRDAINTYGEIERECIEAAIKAIPYLHRLLPLYELMYKRGEGVLWYYDENGNFVLGARNKRGVRQGCVLGMFLSCITMEPMYARLRTDVEMKGFCIPIVMIPISYPPWSRWLKCYTMHPASSARSDCG